MRHLHWFYSQEVNKGDWVFLHTRHGKDSVVRHTDGSLVYHRYWGVDRPVWNDGGDKAILFELS